MNVQDLFQGEDPVASLPTVFYQLQEAIDDPDSTFNDITYVIRNDPGLSARLLRIVNSAFYGFPTRIGTIAHAISIIGMDQLNDLAISTLVIERFQGIPGNLMNMESFWQHSLACGLGAKIIASHHKKEPNPERFFVAGLLHDIGRLVICMKVPDKARESFELSKSEELFLHTAESKVMGFDHADVGGALLQTWKLPASHVEAVAFHHEPAKAAGFPREAATVHVADIIANALQLGCGEEVVIPTLDEAARDLIEMGETIFFSAIMKEVVKQFKQVTEVFLQPA